MEAFQKLINSSTVTESLYKVRQATMNDKEMLPLKQLRGPSRDRGSKMLFDDRRSSNSYSNSDSLQVFIPHLPEEIEKEDLIQSLN